MAGDGGADLVEDELWMVEDHLVGEAQERHALTTEPAIAQSVAACTALVRRPIGLDREPRCGAVEVGEVAANGVLAAELQAEQLAVAK